VIHFNMIDVMGERGATRSLAVLLRLCIRPEALQGWIGLYACLGYNNV
jgi:hypothetical protein